MGKNRLAGITNTTVAIAYMMLLFLTITLFAGAVGWIDVSIGMLEGIVLLGVGLAIGSEALLESRKWKIGEMVEAILGVVAVALGVGYLLNIEMLTGIFEDYKAILYIVWFGTLVVEAYKGKVLKHAVKGMA